MNKNEPTGDASKSSAASDHPMPQPRKIPMLIQILLALVAIVLVLVIIVAVQPSEFHVERSAKISAPPAEVFSQVNNFHAWEAWSPWEKMDPTMKKTYEGPPAGTGAIYSWVGSSQVGEGRMTLTESQPNDLIRIKLEFFKPFAGTNTAEFAFKPERDETLVTWSMDGKYSFIPKAMNLVMNINKMIGGQFETGLAQMKSVVEEANKK